MKKCPYCAELIGTHSKICKYCGETLHIKHTLNVNTMKQNQLNIIVAIFVFLSRDVVSLLKGAYQGTLYVNIPSGLIDIFFAYHLFRRKDWARKWIIGIIISKIIFLGFIYIKHSNYFQGAIDIAMLCCVLVLLFGLGGNKKSVTVTSIYSVLLVIFVGLNLIGVVEAEKAINIIKKTPLIMEQKSEKGFKVILPSNDWRFLKKEASLEIIGDFVKGYDIVVANTNGSVYGTILGVDSTDTSQEKSKLLDNLIEETQGDIEPGFTQLSKLKTTDAAMIEYKFQEQGMEYIMAVFYKLFDKVTVTSYFFGETEEYNKARENVIKLVDDMEEISRKEFMKRLSAKEIYEKNSDAVVLVRIYDKEGNIIGFSSGFNVYENGLIVTNLHTILGGYYMDVKFPNHGVYEDIYIAGLSKTLNDLVILRISGKNLPSVNLDDSMETEIGDKIIAIGNPEGYINTISEGIVSGLRIIDEYPYLQITAPISSGSSGGAVFNEYGNIIGISTLTSEGGQNLNFCIPITEVDNIEVFEKFITLAQFQEILTKMQKEQE